MSLDSPIIWISMSILENIVVSFKAVLYGKFHSWALQLNILIPRKNFTVLGYAHAPDFKDISDSE